MKIYHYHPETKEYIGESEAAKSPLKENVYLIPAFATELAPFLEDGKIPHFENNQWINKDIVQPILEAKKTLEESKQEKINQLKSNRDIALNNSIYSINIDGEGCEFYLKTSDLQAIKGRIDYLVNDIETSSWGCADGRRVQLNKTAFKSLYKQINENDETVYDLYAEKIEEIDNITSDGEYFDENNNKITPLQKLENININFN